MRSGSLDIKWKLLEGQLGGVPTNKRRKEDNVGEDIYVFMSLFIGLLACVLTLITDSVHEYLILA